MDEEIYINQLKGFIVKGKKELVCKLNKSLYALMKSPRMWRMWYKKFDTYILVLGFVTSKANHYVYYKKVGEHFIYVVLNVDDMLLVGKNMEVIKEVKMQPPSKFDTKDRGVSNFILQMEIKRNHVDRKL